MVAANTVLNTMAMTNRPEAMAETLANVVVTTARLLTIPNVEAGSAVAATGAAPRQPKEDRANKIGQARSFVMVTES